MKVAPAPGVDSARRRPPWIMREREAETERGFAAGRRSAEATAVLKVMLPIPGAEPRTYIADGEAEVVELRVTASREVELKDRPRCRLRRVERLAEAKSRRGPHSRLAIHEGAATRESCRWKTTGTRRGNLLS